ncbi:MAG: hypothetical protein ACRCX2_04350 [Paraclostridium sp.]
MISSHKTIYNYMIEKFNEVDTDYIELSIQEIVNDVNLSRATVIRAIRKFEELELIETNYCEGYKNRYYKK